jgi:hypothetical protein
MDGYSHFFNPKKFEKQKFENRKTGASHQLLPLSASLHTSLFLLLK